MRFSDSGFTIWYGTPDCAAPDGIVESSKELNIFVAVGYEHPNKSRMLPYKGRVTLYYSVNGSEFRTVHVNPHRLDNKENVSYFKATFPTLFPGDEVRYFVIYDRVGQQIPTYEEGKNLASSFKIVEPGIEQREDRPQTIQPDRLAKSTGAGAPGKKTKSASTRPQPESPRKTRIAIPGAKKQSGSSKLGSLSREKAKQELTMRLQAKGKIGQKTRKLRAAIGELERRIERALRRGRQDELEELIENLEQLRGELKEKEKSLVALDRGIARLRRRLDELEPAVDEPHPNVSDRYPILLFPVRLETRFMPETNPTELWVRIYPDQIAIDNHEEELSAEEVKAGSLYRDRVAEAGSEENVEKKKQAWRDLARQVGPARAAWIIKRLPDYDDRELSELAPSSSPETPGVRVMPDYFVVRLYQGDACVREQSGNLIKRDPLPVLWNPAEEPAEGEQDELFDEGSRWVMDFNAALNEGMAITIRLADLDYQKGFDRVIAIGMKTSVDAQQGVDLFEGLINAHHYTDGIGFLRHGTPTNNTQTAKSGNSRSKRDIEGSYAIECFPQDVKPLNGNSLWNRDRSAASVMEHAFGLKTPEQITELHGDHPKPGCPLFRHIEHANDIDLSFSRHMHEALWPATWGAYLEGLLGIAESPNELRVLRKQFRDFVSARGPLPSIRVGNLPYGILPATKIREWKPSPADWWRTPDTSTTPEQWMKTAESMHSVLVKLFDLFLDIAADPIAIPKIGDSEDPDQELLRILAMEPGSVSYGLRNVVMDNFVRALTWFAAPSYFGRGSIYEGTGKTPYQRVTDWLAIWQEQLETNAELLDNITGLPVQNNYPNISPLILRLFLWGGSASLSMPLVVKTSDDTDIGADCTLGKFIDFALKMTDSPSEIFQEAIKTLKELPEDTLTGLFKDCLDLSTHRIDAWITSLATKRLYAMRRDKAYRHGIYIGAYGWLENLHPKQPGRPPLQRGEAVSPETFSAEEISAPAELTIPSGRPSPESMKEARESQPLEIKGGFIHAPSLGQAAAAAVTRSAYISSVNDGVPDASKVNLSSDRVRRALRIIDGVRQGQTLGVMLGIQIEKALHDHSLDKYIDELRRAFPLKVGKETKMQGDESTEAVAARNVVDGKALAEAWREILSQTDSPTPQMLSEELTEDNEQLKRELGRLPEALDAVSDLWFAEAIYQGTQGRYERMGAALDAAAGTGPIPEVECVRTPSSGHSDTHRVCILFDANYQILDPTDSGYAFESRAQAEPLLNTWAKRVLGDLGQIQCGVSVPSEDDTILYSLNDLGISAMDFVYMSSTPPSGEESELEQLIRYEVWTNNGLSADTEVKIDFDRSATDDRDDGHKSMGEAIEVARSLLQVIGNATGLHPSMLCLPEEGGTEEGEDETTPASNGKLIGVFTDADYTELENRVRRSLAGLKTVIPGGVLTGNDETDAAIINGVVLNKARKFGVPNTIPVYTAADDPVKVQEDMNHRKRAVFQEVISRQKKANTLIAQAEAYGVEKLDNKIRTLIQAMKAIFGNSFTVLPSFKAPVAGELENALNANTASNTRRHILGGKGQDRIWLWLQQAAQTHPALGKLETMLMMEEAWANTPLAVEASCDEVAGEFIAPTQSSRFHIAQLPYREVDRWTALAKDEWNVSDEDLAVLESRPQGCISLAIHAPFPITVNGDTQRIAGILIDQWEERIPSSEEITGVSFNYDQPNAQAPNALLLAVPGEWDEKEGHWSLADLFETVYDTMDLTKVRLVDLDAFRKVGQFLPALYLPKMTANQGADGKIQVSREMDLRRTYRA